VSTYSFPHLADPVLLRELAATVAHDRATTALLLAYLAEVDARRLYLPAAYPSMYAWCVGELQFSEDEAYSRIRAARTARRFPAIFDAVAARRLHVSGILALAPHLTPENAEALLAAAAHQSKAGIEALLAERFPRSECLAMVEAMPAPQLGPERVAAPTPRPKVTPVAQERYAAQFMMDKEMHDDLRSVQALLGHQIPSGDLATVFARALKTLRRDLERRKFAATTRPRARTQRSNKNPRHIPAEVKRTVWERDQGQCTFVSETGHRCPARSPLEFDHADPVAHGGEATVSGIRLRCRAHNQYGADCVFGAGFMSEKREAARAAAAERRAWRIDKSRPNRHTSPKSFPT